MASSATSYAAPGSAATSYAAPGATPAMGYASAAQGHGGVVGSAG